MPRLCFRALRRTALTISAAAAICTVPALAQQAGSTGFAKRIGATINDYPASSGRFDAERGERSGPADISATLSERASWRMCGECGYHAALPRAPRTFAIHANFQPIGGTVSYRF